MASETSMIEAIKGKLKKLPGVACKKIHSGAMNRDIDLLITVWGLACFIEIKVLGKMPSEWQYNRLAFWAASGAYTDWFDKVDDCIDFVTELAEGGPGCIDFMNDISVNCAKAAHWKTLSIKAGNYGS